jgi:hypothetical protein
MTIIYNRRQLRKSPLAQDGKIALSDMVEIFKLYKVGLSEEAKRLLKEEYAVSEDIAEKFRKVSYCILNPTTTVPLPFFLLIACF